MNAASPGNMAAIAHPYTPPEGTLPLLAGILAAMHHTHRDMLALVADLPPDALTWKPGAAMGSLVGIARHTLYCERYVFVAASGADFQYDEATNAEQWDATDDANALARHIVGVDEEMKAALPSLTVPDLGARLVVWGGPGESSVGELIADVANHSAMHWGHMQMTRQLWEAAHPEFTSAYTRW